MHRETVRLLSLPNLIANFGFDPVPKFVARRWQRQSHVNLVGDAWDQLRMFDRPLVPQFEMLDAQLLAEFNKDIATNINLKWRYLLFANYENLNFKEIDHRLDINLTAKVNKFVNVSLGAIMLYDYDQDSGLQISEAFSLGVMYTVQNFKP